MVPDTLCACTCLPAINFGERAAHLPIDMLVLHYTGMETGEAAVEWLCNAQSGVSCHYLVHEDGAILQMVPEALRAWHAGASSWQGERDTNSRSIGIEIVNPGHEGGYPDFPDAQIGAVIALCGDILSRHAIPARNVLGHSDVAPGRKADPGEKFPWDRLFRHGVGHWVEPVGDQTTYLVPGQNAEEVAGLKALLVAYGYDLEITGEYDTATEQCVTAFQRHFRQATVNGIADAGTHATLENLLRTARRRD